MSKSNWVQASQIWAHPPTLEMVRADFLRVLAETGNSMEAHRAIVADYDTQGPMPPGYDYFELRQSSIDGFGMFTTKFIAQGEEVGPALVDGKRTPLGRYGNHSPVPNTAFKRLPNGDAVCIALVDVSAGSEIVGNYRQGAALCGEHFEPGEIATTLMLRSEQFRIVSESVDG